MVKRVLQLFIQSTKITTYKLVKEPAWIAVLRVVGHGREALVDLQEVTEMETSFEVKLDSLIETYAA